MAGASRWYRFMWAFAAAVVFMVLNGYRFGNGDQEEHLPYVYKLLDAGLYPHDPLLYVQTTEFTVRFYFAHILAEFGRYFPVEGSVFVLYLLSLTCICAGISALASEWGAKAEKSVLIPFLLYPINGFTIGGNTLIDIQLTCTVPAAALGIWSLVWAQRNRAMAAGVCAALAAWFQVLVGLQVGLIALLWIVCSAPLSAGWRSGLTHFAPAFLVFILPVIVPLSATLTGPGTNPEAARYAWILFDVRNPHHYLPDHFPIKDYLKSLVLWTVAALVSYRWSRAQFSLRLMPACALFVLGAIVYTLGLLIFESTTIGMTQWFKCSIWPGYISLVLICISIPFQIKTLDFNSTAAAAWSALGVALLVLCFVGLGSDLLPDRLAKRYEWGRGTPDPRRSIHTWIRLNLPKDAVVLPPPDDDAFLCEAQRSVPVSYKAIVHTSSFMLDWYTRFCSVYGLMPYETGQVDPLLKRASERYISLADSEVISPVAINYRLIRTEVAPSELPLLNNIIRAEPPYYLIRFPATKRAAE